MAKSIKTSGFKRLSCREAKKLINSSPNVIIADIRDRASFEMNHMPDSIHLNNQNIEMFLNNTEKDLPLLIYCYHGNNSQGAAEYFVGKGFREVYSMDGGFTEFLNSK